LAGSIAQATECLSGEHTVLSSNASTTKEKKKKRKLNVVGEYVKLNHNT
jgi:hypothetical protein